MRPKQKKRPNLLFEKVKNDIDWSETQSVGYYFFAQIGDREALFIQPKDDVAVCYIFESSIVNELFKAFQNFPEKFSLIRKDDIIKLE